MSEKDKILEGFDDYAKAKKNSNVFLRLIIIFCLAVVISVLFFAFSLIQRSQDNVKVVTKSGQYLQTELTSRERMFKVLLKNHCASAVYFANSFDRLTIKENQAKSLFLIKKEDALRIFAKYQADKAYGDALDRGLMYKASFQKIDELSGENEPYHVRFTSLLQVFNNDQPVTEYIIKSEGDIVSYTPQYPENVSGFYFTKYSQTYQAASNE